MRQGNLTFSAFEGVFSQIPHLKQGRQVNCFESRSLEESLLFRVLQVSISSHFASILGIYL